MNRHDERSRRNGLPVHPKFIDGDGLGWLHFDANYAQWINRVALNNGQCPSQITSLVTNTSRLIQLSLTTERVIIPLVFPACPASFSELDKFWHTSWPSQRLGQIIWILRRPWNPCPLGNYSTYSTFIHHSHRTRKFHVTQWPAGEVYWWWQPLGWSCFSADCVPPVGHNCCRLRNWMPVLHRSATTEMLVDDLITYESGVHLRIKILDISIQFLQAGPHN